MMISLLQPYFSAFYDGRNSQTLTAIDQIFSDKATFNLCHPLGSFNDTEHYKQNIITPLFDAIPNIERRDAIRVSGYDDKGQLWVGCMGHYIGTFIKTWLSIPATNALSFMRYHEFFRIENNQILEMQAIWDLPSLMMQAQCWPMSPSLGVEMLVPAPASQDGILRVSQPEQSEQSLELVGNMLTGLSRFASGGVAAMQLEKYWHSNFNWYGPAGIGSSRGVAGFRKCHQIPFLNALPDRVGNVAAGHFFAEDNYVAFTAWPGMYMTVSGDGWLGIPPVNQKITMRSLDFWRCEKGLIRENWVLVDLLDVYHQIGVNVFNRMQELTQSKL